MLESILQDTRKPGVTDTYPPYTSASGADVDSITKGVGGSSISGVSMGVNESMVTKVGT